MIEKRELLDPEEHGPAFRVGKTSIGTIREFRIARDLSLGAAGLVAANFVPDGLRTYCSGSSRTGMMTFVRLKLD